MLVRFLNTFYKFDIALIAQWIERYPPEVKVAGSNPAKCTYFLCYYKILMWSNNIVDVISLFS